MFLISFLLFFMFCNSECIVKTSADGLNTVADDSPIVVSLSHYNVLSPDGESLDSIHTLAPNSTSKIIVTDIPKEIYFVVVQAHSYLMNVTLSYSEVPVMENSIRGTNVGLVKFSQKTDLEFYLIYDSGSDYADVLVTVQAYTKDAPIPGGCNMEFPVEVSPFLFTSYNDAITEVDFAHSAPPKSIFSDAIILPSDECNIKPSPVFHEMYHQYFPERDFSKETYFTVLKSMMTKGRILRSSSFVPKKLTGSVVKRFFATYPGTGNAFVVISQYGNYSSVYVPSFTYGCDESNDNRTCDVLGTTFSKILCSGVLIKGLCACFFGHYFFRIEIFLFTFLISGIISYIFVTLLFSNSIALFTGVCLGLLSSIIMVLAKIFFSLPITSIVLTTLAVGYLLASIILYILVDFVDLFVSDINYWGVFIGIVLACPILMLGLVEKANIISCAFMGSYVAIVSIDYYIGSNLRFIVINTIRRAIVPNFKLAVVDPPFQLKDILLCVVWAIILLTGLASQLKLLKNKPPFPPPPPVSHYRSSDEITPLLSGMATRSGPVYVT